ncbi:helix-turn-helix transcriptional regulator [Candidatus Saccharibacteria bacterium]|nr:helix-turn-helix transcriptional regulator [Candidatus Saccharibacteria bacterium]
MKFKDNLRKIRTAAHFSQEKLAERMSVSRQTITKWENGASLPSTEHILKLAEVLSCTFDELVLGEKVSNISTKKPPMLKTLFTATALITLSLIFAFGLFRLSFNRDSLDRAKLATFGALAEDFVASTDLLPETAEKKIVGYGISAEDGAFYIKCDLKDADGHCSAIIYFCKNADGYFYRCELLTDPDFRPSGTYYQLV